MEGFHFGIPLFMKHHIMNNNKESVKVTLLHEVMNRKDDKGNFVLTPLLYTDDHLEPYIGERTVRYHYYKHLQAYIYKVNVLKAKAKGIVPNDASIENIIEAETRGSLFNNASQVFNHYFYFEQLNPKGAKEPMPKMKYLIENEYGTWDKLKAQITDAAMSIFGSGWVFLTRAKNGAFSIHSYVGTGTPLTENMLIALDVWEHAYYLDYQNDRKLYIERFFEAIDWSVIEKRLII